VVNRGGKRKERLGSRPSQSRFDYTREVHEGETPSQPARLACDPGEKLGTSVSRNGTSNEKKGERLRGGAAEGAGERGSDVGGDDDLFGRFLWLHLFAAARSDPGWRIQHPAVLDDFPDL
jgi:hypothetical protein